MATPLDRKVNKLLQGYTDSLNGLSSIYNSNTLTNRRNLRNILNKNILYLNNELIDNFNNVENELNKITDYADILLNNCNILTKKLQDSKSTSTILLDQMHKLQEEKNLSQSKLTVSQDLYSILQLTQSEIDIISNQDDISSDFFNIFDKIQNMKSNIKYLCKFHQLEIDVTDQADKYFELALEKLYRWFMQLIPNSNFESSPYVSKVLSILELRPVYYDNCILELVNSRRANLIRSFTSALQGYAPNDEGIYSIGKYKAIDMHAHDPYRHLSDMFVWVHVSMMSEKEILESLFYSEDCASKSIVDVRKNSLNRIHSISNHSVDLSAHKAKKQNVEEILYKIMSSLVKPLKLRVEQALDISTTPLLSYQLYLIISFYSKKIGKILGKQSPEEETLTSLLELLESAALTSYNSIVGNLFTPLIISPPTSFDLLCPSLLRDCIRRMVLVMKEAALNKASITADSNNTSLVSSVDPIVTGWVELSSKVVEEAGKEMREEEKEVFRINCYGILITELETFDFAELRVEVLKLHMENSLQALIRYQTSLILHRCMLDDKVEKWKVFQQNKERNIDTIKSLSLVDGMSFAQLQPIFKAFYVAIFSLSLTSALPPPCERISDIKIKSLVRTGIAKLVSTIHATLYEAISDPQNGYTDPAAILLHTPDQIEILLDYK